MLSADETTWLLTSLCSELGFCLPPEARARLTATPPLDVDAFTAAVFQAEGLDPAAADRRLYRRVRALVAGAFERSAALRR
jgi:hypothetical protein